MSPPPLRGVPDSHSGIVGHSTHHGGLGALDDTLVLGWLGDACPGCKRSQGYGVRDMFSDQGCWAGTVVGPGRGRTR